MHYGKFGKEKRQEKKSPINISIGRSGDNHCYIFCIIFFEIFIIYTCNFRNKIVMIVNRLFTDQFYFHLKVYHK